MGFFRMPGMQIWNLGLFMLSTAKLANSFSLIHLELTISFATLAATVASLRDYPQYKVT
jgi:hypothetical protein